MAAEENRLAVAVPAPLYHGIAVALPLAVATAEEARASMRDLLIKFRFSEEVAPVVAAYLVDTLGIESMDDFRCAFRADTAFNTLVIAKCRMPALVGSPHMASKISLGPSPRRPHKPRTI